MSGKAGLREYQIQLKTGQPETLNFQGNYLRISTALYSVIVEIGDNDIYQLAAGEDVAYPVDDEFRRVRIKTLSPADDSVKIMIGRNVRVGSAKVSGAVSISGTPTVINGGGTLTDITNTVKVREDGFSYGAAHKVNTLMGAAAVETVVAPGANVNGIVLWDAQIFSTNGGYLMSLLSKTSAPTSVADGDIYLIAKAINQVAHLHGELKRPVRVPAGRGLYFYNTTAESGASVRSALYTLLP